LPQHTPSGEDFEINRVAKSGRNIVRPKAW
jgi:hypothetical protein